jgi:photosystem II stability/assembly factor-like uncharacterized protein
MFSNDGRTIVAAGCEQSSNSNLIYRSNDGGKTWEDLDLKASGLPLSEEGIQRSVAAPGSTTDFLVLLGFRGDRKNNNPGMYRTTDGGSNWAKTASDPFGKDWITAMAVDPTIGGRLWITGKGKGLSRSDDAGDTWTKQGDFIDASQVAAVKGCVAVWGRRRGDEWNKLYYSADDGATWMEVTGPGRRLPFLHNVTINPHKTNELWVSGISVNILTIDVPAAKAVAEAGQSSTGNWVAKASL